MCTIPPYRKRMAKAYHRTERRLLESLSNRILVAPGLRGLSRSLPRLWIRALVLRLGRLGLALRVVAGAGADVEPSHAFAWAHPPGGILWRPAWWSGSRWCTGYPGMSRAASAASASTSFSDLGKGHAAGLARQHLERPRRGAPRLPRLQRGRASRSSKPLAPAAPECAG